MCKVCSQDYYDNTRSEQLSDEEIDKSNMDAIDDYIKAKKEYDEKGYYTGFMNIKFYEKPIEPKLLKYSWEK